jgi:hypothetical protein
LFEGEDKDSIYIELMGELGRKIGFVLRDLNLYTGENVTYKGGNPTAE